MKNTYKQIKQYCEYNITDYEDRASIAMGLMDRHRAPLDMVAWALYDDIMTAIDEWCEENEMSPNDIEPEDIIFA